MPARRFWYPFGFASGASDFQLRKVTLGGRTGITGARRGVGDS